MREGSPGADQNSRSRTTAAHDLLSATYAKFTEGFGSSDLIRAQGLIEDLEAAKPSV